MKSMTKTDIRDIVRLHKEYENFSKVARTLGISKTTVTKYVRLDQRSVLAKVLDWWRASV